MDLEIVSFIFKFQQLNHLGRNANLLLKSYEGKVSLNLSVEIGSLQVPYVKEFPMFILSEGIWSTPYGRYI